MVRELKIAAMAVVFGVCIGVPAHGAAYIKFDGIDGESKDKRHSSWSDLSSFSQVLHLPGQLPARSARRRGDVVLEDLVCVKELDKSSPLLMEAICTGRVFPTVRIEVDRVRPEGRTA